MSRSKKITFITRLYKPHIGGIEKHIEELCEVLKKRGYEVSIITEKYEENLRSSEEVDGIQIYRFSYPKIRFFGLLVIWIKLLRFLLLFLKSDVIHIHDVFLWGLPYRILLPFKRVCMTFHGYSEYPIRRITVLQKRISNFLINSGLGIGEFIEKWFEISLKKISYGAVNLKKFKPRKTKILYDAVFASRLHEQTGILEYLKAIEILKKKYDTDIKVVVLGGGKFLEEAGQLTIAEGFVDDVTPYFNQSRLAFVNRYLAILEAFQNKKLVIATYRTEIKRDYLMMTPFKDWIVVEKDPEELAEKIKFYLDNPEKAKPMIEAAYEWVQDQTWEKMADTYEELWGIKDTDR